MNNIDLPCAVSVVYVYETSKIYSFVALCFVFKSLKEKTYHCISNFVFFIPGMDRERNGWPSGDGA